MIETLLFSIILLYHIVILHRSLPELDGNPLTSGQYVFNTVLFSYGRWHVQNCRYRIWPRGSDFTIVGSHAELLVKIRAADFSQVKPHTGGRTGCACAHVRSTSNWPVVPVEEEPVDPLELVVPEAVAVPVFPRLIPLLPQIGRGPILKGTHFFFPCFEMNNALTFYMKTPNERRATSLGKKDKASCRVQGVKRNTEITVAVVLRMRLQLFLVFDWVTYKLRDLTVCSLGYYTMLLIQPRFLLHGAEVIGFSLFELWL